jgi:hypothetical protein
VKDIGLDLLISYSKSMKNLTFLAESNALLIYVQHLALGPKFFQTNYTKMMRHARRPPLNRIIVSLALIYRKWQLLMEFLYFKVILQQRRQLIKYLKHLKVVRQI